MRPVRVNDRKIHHEATKHTKTRSDIYGTLSWAAGTPGRPG